MSSPVGLLCGLLLALISIQNLILWRSSSQTAPHLIPLPSAKQTPASSLNDNANEKWQFVPARDANNIAFTSSQCDSTFPKLYTEIDRSVTLWRDRKHPLTAQDTSIAWRRDAAFRLLIHNNSLRVLETKQAMNDAYRRRTFAVLHQLHTALLGARVAGETLPTIEFAVTVDDMSLIPNGNDTHAIWAFTRRLIDREQDRCWLMPDFNFWAGPAYTGSFYEAQTHARSNDAFVLDKIPQAVWRGALWTNRPLRESLLAKTAEQPWADVAETFWENGTNVMALEDFCKYAFVIHTEGRSWSGRLKYLLNCDSVPIVHDLDWAAHYYHLLVSKGVEQNHIPVRRSWSDLGEKVQYYIAHPPKAQRIAENAVAKFRDRYLTSAAEACYWRRLIRGYGEVAVEPEVFEPREVSDIGEWVGTDRLRGIAFEEFVSLGTEWPITVKS